MKKTYDGLWWTTKTPADHFSEYIWDNNIYDDWGPTLDDHKAYAISVRFIPKYYIHDKRVKIWLAEKWALWEKDPPFWFDDSFKQSLHPSVVPKNARIASGKTVLKTVRKKFAAIMSLVSNRNAAVLTTSPRHDGCSTKYVTENGP